jgi:hypothetical protein
LRASFPAGPPSHPRAQELELSETGSAGVIAQALAQPSMPRLRLLKLYYRRSGARPVAELFTPLWEAPWFSQLQELSVSTDQGFGDAGLAPLRAAPLLQRLSLQTFGGARNFADVDGRVLAAASLPELRELRMHDVAPGLVAALAAAPWLCGITLLQLTGGRQGHVGGLAAADGRALAAAPLLSLNCLILTNVELAFMAACAAASWLRRLDRLSLNGTGDLIGGAASGGGGGGILEASWAATPFTTLGSVSLSYSGTAPPSEASRFAALVAAPWFGRLHTLHLSGCPVGTAGGSNGAGLRALATATLPNLHTLHLTNACLSATDVSGVLSSAPWLTTLTKLTLFSNDLGADGHRALSLLHLPRLRDLFLWCNGIDGMGVAALVAAPWLTQLTKLHITEDEFESAQSYVSMARAINDDAWVFGRLRRLGCDIECCLMPGMG